MTISRSSPPIFVGTSRQPRSPISHGYSEGNQLTSPYRFSSRYGGMPEVLLFGSVADEKENVREHGGRSSDMKRGLRQFSITICKKVREMKVTTYSEVADDLIKDIGCRAERNEEKNIRRRVYDALNVFIAIGMIRKEKKSIVWQGGLISSHQEIEKLIQREEDMKKEILRKKKELQELLDKCVVVQNLINRNRKRKDNPDEVLYLPFILVGTSKQSKVDCEMHEDGTYYSFVFDKPFRIYEDTSILKILYSHGQERSLTPVNFQLSQIGRENSNDQWFFENRGFYNKNAFL